MKKMSEKQLKNTEGGKQVRTTQGYASGHAATTKTVNGRVYRNGAPANGINSSGTAYRNGYAITRNAPKPNSKSNRRTK